MSEDEDDGEGYRSGDGEDAEDDLEASKEVGGKLEGKAAAEDRTPSTTHPQSLLTLAWISLK